jgi:hypothetical protein
MLSGKLLDWQTKALIAIFCISVAFFVVCYFLFGLVLVTAAAIVVPAIVVILGFSASLLRRLTRVTPTIEQKHQRVLLSDIIKRDHWKLYDPVNWEFMEQKPLTEETTLDKLYQLHGEGAIKNTKEVVCFKAANFGSNDVKLQRFYVGVKDSLLPVFPGDKQVWGNSQQLYMDNRALHCEKRGKDLFAPAIEYVKEYKDLHDGGLGLSFSKPDFEGRSCWLKQQDYSGCQMWIDAVCLAFYIFDHGFDNIKEIRWICESRVGKLHKSERFRFNVKQLIEETKWHATAF